MTNELVGISFCSGNAACYIDIIDNPEWGNILLFLRNLFENEFKLLIAQNISYDLKVLGKYNIKPSKDCKLFDTLTAAHLIDENSPKNLKFLAKKYLNKDLKSWEEVVKFGYHSQTFYDYGITDAECAYELFGIFSTLLKSQGLKDLFTDIEMPFQRVKIDLETNGVLVDREKLIELENELRNVLYDLQIKMCESVNIEYAKQMRFDGGEDLLTGINFNSSQQLVKLITKKLGLKITEKTDKGNPSVSDDSLKNLKGKHEFIVLLRAYKKATKLQTSFTTPFPKFIDEDDRIRCNYSNTVAVTGRVTSSKPNLLQLPRKSDEVVIPFEFRSCFVAPIGKKIVVCDYAGQELCWLAEVTQDKNLINDIKKGVDIHLAVANEIFKLRIPQDCLIKTTPYGYSVVREQYKEKRHRAKNGVVFPVIYGKTAYGIAKEFGISQKEAESWLDGLFSLYPDVKKSIAACHKQIDETGEVINWFGRIRRLLSESSTDKSDKYRAYRQGFNFLVQGPSAEQMKKAATSVRNLFNAWNKSSDNWGAKIIIMVYDELVYEINEKYADVSIDFVKDCMQDAVKISVPFTVDSGVGQNYASAKN